MHLARKLLQITSIRPQLHSLSQELLKLSESAKPSTADQKALEDALHCLRETGKKCLDASRVLPFGSAVTGFWTPHSDVDVCLQTPVQRSLSPKAENLAALKLVARELRKEKSTVNLFPVYTGKVPVVKWRSRQGDEKEISIDLSVNNLLAVRNSELLRAYNASSPNIRPLILGIKLFAKSRGINDRSSGTLSSFSLVLMLLAYLQQRKPALLPDLQLMAQRKNLPSMKIDGKETRFFGDEFSGEGQMQRFKAAIDEELHRVNRGVSVPEISSGQLLKEFLRFYAFEYKGGVIKVTQPSDYSHSSLFFVENPFEPGRDVANVTHQGSERILSEFKRAYRLLSAGKSLVDVCRGGDS